MSVNFIYIVTCGYSIFILTDSLLGIYAIHSFILPLGDIWVVFQLRKSSKMHPYHMDLRVAPSNITQSVRPSLSSFAVSLIPDRSLSKLTTTKSNHISSS